MEYATHEEQIAAHREYEHELTLKRKAFRDAEYASITRDPFGIFTLKDSGQRQEFDSGAVRDIQEGKGHFASLPYPAMLRLALVFERGAKKYGRDNWKLGMPIERYLESALRHAFQYLEGHQDEDHLGQACWNLIAALATEEWCEAGKLPKDLLLKSRQTYLDHPESDRG